MVSPVPEKQKTKILQTYQENQKNGKYDNYRIENLKRCRDRNPDDPKWEKMIQNEMKKLNGINKAV